MGWSRIQNGGPPSAQGGLYGELSTGNRDRGALKKRYKDCLKTSLNVWHIDCLQWSDMVPHRDVWRDTVHKAASQFEENRRDSLKNKRQRRKAQAASTTKNPDLTYTARGPACLASASSATNWPPVGVDNNLPDLRSQSQAKQQFLPLSLLKFRSLIFFSHAWNYKHRWVRAFDFVPAWFLRTSRVFYQPYNLGGRLY